MTQITHTVSREKVPIGSYWIASLSVLVGAGFVVLIAVSLFFVAKNYRPTLNWDQWGDLQFLINIKNGMFSLPELFTQNNEHRIFTSRLFFLIDALWFGYLNIFLLTVIFISQLILGGIIALLWFDHTYDIRIRAAACLGGAAILVAIVQFDNLIWGFQTQMSHLYLFALLALLALGGACVENRSSRRWIFLALYVILNALAAFTMANGLIVLGAAVMLMIFLGGRWSAFIVVGVSGLTVAIAYLHGYHTPAHLSLADRLTLAPHIMRYACDLLTAPLTTHSLARALLGACVIGSLLFATGTAIWDLHAGRRTPMAPAVLMCLAGFVFVSAVLTGIGRFGVEQASSGRYATAALVFWLSMVGVATWLIVERLKIAHSMKGRHVFAVVCLAAMLAEGIRLDFDATTQRIMSEWARRIDRASMALINNVYMTEGVGLDVLFVPPVIKARVGELRALGWNIFSPRQKTYAPPVHLIAGLPEAGTPTCRGFVDRVIRLDSQRVALRGWLLGPTVAQSPSWVFLRDQQGGVVGYFIPLDWRPDLIEQFGLAAGNGYFAGIDFKRAVPAGNLKISLVAVFDDSVEQTCTFPSELNVPAYEIASDYGQLRGKPIPGLRANTRGPVTPQGWPPGFPGLPVENPSLFTVGPPSPEPATITFRFDASALGSEDLAIPVAANTGYDFRINISTLTNGSIETLTLNTLYYNLWKIWRIAIIPRGSLPANDEILVTIQIPPKVLPAGATVGPPFATPANANRAALY
jgi:hypothetical protein